MRKKTKKPSIDKVFKSNSKSSEEVTAPEEGNHIVEAQSVGEASPLESVIDDGQLTSIYVDLDINTELQIKSLKDQYLHHDEIDQKFLYIDSQSVELWKGVIACGTYTTYNHCKATLETLTGTGYWHELVAESPTNKLVDLGVGAGDKDYEILRSFVEHCNEDETVTLTLLDSSLVMLDVSLFELKELATKITVKKRNNISVRAIRGNMLKLPKYRNLLNHGEGKNIYFLLGGTFSNIGEDDFMKAFTETTEVGDVIVIAAEMYDSADPDASMESIKKDYKAGEIFEFAKVPVMSHLKARGKHLDLNYGGIGKPVKIDIKSGKMFSDVDAAKTLVFSIRVSAKPVKVISTSRYDYERLKSFFEQFPFDLKKVVTCPSNKFYKYFCLERK